MKDELGVSHTFFIMFYLKIQPFHWFILGWDILDKYKREILQLYMTFTNTFSKELQSLNLSMTNLKRTRNLHDLVVENEVVYIFLYKI
jgi:hypothetical protein